MGILNDLKRLFWVKRAVAESAADKAVEKGKEFGEDIAERASDAWQKGKEKAEEISQKITSTTKDAMGDAKEKASDMWNKDDWSPKNPEKPVVNPDSSAHKLGEKVGEAASRVGDAAGKTWDKAKEEGKELVDKAVKVSDKIWEKAEDVGEDLMSKAKTVAEKASEKFQEGVDSMLEKAKALDKQIEAERDKIDPNRDGWADKPVSEKLRETGSTLKDKDDFFERAERYSEGDYSMGKPVVIKPEGEDKTDEGMTELPPLPEDDDFADDAILDDDKPEK